MIQPLVLYENDEILVIDKPAGLAVQGGKGVAHSLDKDFSQQLGYRIFLVHRLDKDTGGLMLVAKTSAAAAKWTRLVGTKAVQKEYVALCAGSLFPRSGVIRETLEQHGTKKSAVTRYAVEAEKELELDGQKITLSRIRLALETGRMHQIRIHLAKNGCPIAGDDLHGNFKVNRLLKKALGIKSLMLRSVRLVLPLDGQKVFELPIETNFSL